MAIIEFEGLGNDLLQGVKAAKDAVAGLRDETEKSGAAMKKTAQENAAALDSFGKVIEVTTNNLTRLKKVSESGTGTLAKNIDSATTSAGALNKAMGVTAQDIAKATFAAKALSDQQKQIVADAQKVQKAIASGNITQAKGLEILNQLGEEYTKNAALIQQITKAASQVNASLGGAAEPAKSLRTQLRESREELDRLVDASNGKITPELIAAAKRAGELKDRFGDLNATVEAFNPDTKFRALIGVLGNVASGAQAAVAGMGLFGAQTDDVNKALLKIQQTTAFIQGLQGFMGGLADNWKNLKTVVLASTVATEANTAATATSTAALGAQAAATEVATGATVTFRGAITALKAALLANPITAATVAILATSTAIYELTGNSDAADESVKALGDSLERIEKMKFDDLDFSNAVAEVRDQIAAIGRAEGDYNSQIAATDGATQRQISTLRIKAKALRDDADLQMATAQAAFAAGELSNDALKEATAAAKEKRDRASAFEDDITLAYERGRLARKQIEQKETDDAKQAADERAKALIERKKALNDQLIALDEDLAKRSNAAQLQFADPRARIDLQKEAAQAEVTVLEEKLKATNAALGRGNRLTAEQDAQLAAVRVAIQEASNEQLLELNKKYSNDRIQLIVDAGERERAEFDAQLKARVEVLKEAGATEVQIAKFTQAQQDAFREKHVNDAIDLEEKIALAKIDAMKQGNETVEEFQKRIALARLDVQETAAKQRLDAIKDNLSDEAVLTRAGLEKILNDIENKRKELKAKKPDIDLFDLLGINVDETQKQRILNDLKTIVNAVQQAVDANIQAQQAQIQAQVEATEQIVDDQRSRREQLQSELDQALQDQRDGYANNADAIRAQIEQTEKTESDALAQKRRLIAEQRELARQQVIVDSVVQASALATGIANLIKTWATIPLGVGLVSAFAEAASIYAFFAGIKEKLAAASASTPQFAEGGLLDGPSHQRGGVALIDRRTGQHFATAEGGEFVTNKRSTTKYRSLLEAINESDQSRLQTAAINELMAHAGISLDRGKVREIIRTKETLIRTERQMMPEGFDAMRREIRALREEVRSFRVQEGGRPQESADGKTIKEPNRTVRRR